MTRNSRHMMDEPDIGSGEKSPVDAETQKMMEQISQSDHSDSVPPEKPAKDKPAQHRDTR